MTFRDDIAANLVVTDFAGMFAAIAAGIRAEAEASPPTPLPPDFDTQRTADADAAVTASMTDARKQSDAWTRGDDGLLD